MNIGIVCYPTFGGSGVVATELGKALAKEGHQVHFITYKQPVRLDLLNPNIFFHEVSTPAYPLFKYQPYELALSSKIVDMVKRHNIELLHVHYAIPHAYAAFMAAQILKEANIKLPIVTTLHGTDITLVGSHPFYKPAVTFSINKSDAVTTVSESLKKDTFKYFNIKKDITVIPNFIDFDIPDNAFSNCERTQMAPDDCKIITHISNFRKVKRIPDIIKVFYNVQKAVYSKLILIGEGPEKIEAKKLVRQLEIDNKVIFLGNSAEVSKILCFSDLFLLPSETESFGLVALEAMANRTPVISTNSGGLPEVNIHKKTGYMYPIGAINAMSEAAIKILQNDSQLNILKKQAFEHSKGFDIKTILPKYTNLYRKTIESINVVSN